MRIRLAFPLTVKDACSFTDALSVGYDLDTPITHISTDTRDLCSGDLFIALSGEHFDGREFTNAAHSVGAVVLTDKAEKKCLLVKSTALALLSLAREYKRLFPKLKHRIAITGSSGKTTTKNFLLKILGSAMPTHGTNENENNTVGAPLTVLAMPADTEALVIEAGMNSLGEISKISKCIEPTLSVITNIGSSHIGRLGSENMIVRAKSEIKDGMSGGVILTEHGEERLSHLENRKTVSLEYAEADYFLFPVSEGLSGSSLDFHLPSATVQNISVPFFGRQIIHSLAYALAAAAECGLGTDNLAKGASKIDGECLRYRILQIDDFIVFDDAYNASPEAVVAALAQLKTFKANPRGALLGDILELGSKTAEIHRELGAIAYRSGITHLYLFGVYSTFTAEGAIGAGMDVGSIFINNDTSRPELSAKQIYENHSTGEVILFKASHRTNLARVTEILRGQTHDG
ncbi:MAG: UDP-N-acetylmuramoyl-tripeptide--D-alanyl-D-alanine ligase [Clostridia bacterium]|nr:UDP-N-acetylmuramoyl-tripeptide--D-alanyl-D-alanine ligase [Clostridia bacterium]